MLFSYNWLQSFFNKKLPEPQKLAEILTMHFAEVEEIKKEKNDFILDIDVRPNRASDAFSHLGVAREIAAILSYKINIPKITLKEDKKLDVRNFIEVEIKNPSACSRYTVRVIDGIKVGPSPNYIKERLEICGLRPINSIVDIVNYVMLETGQPLHAFDADKLDGKRIIVRFAKRGEKIITLDEEEYDLDEKILVIADAKRPIAIAGVKGGKFPGINSETKTIVLESANFNPRIIRRTSRKMDLKTDASLRFEHGIDQNLTEIAINRAAVLIKEITGGKIAGGIIDFYPRKIFPKKVALDLNYAKNLLGLEISKKEAVKILNSLELKTKEMRPNVFEVLVPTNRLDINLAEDLIEEIARIYGYERIPAVPPMGIFTSPKRNDNIFWQDMVKNILKESGFSEVYNYSFVGEGEIKNFGFNQNNLIEIENPLSLSQQYLRPSLIINLLKNAKENLKYFNEIKIFELGKIFNKNFGEKWMLAGSVSKKKEAGEELFFEAKGAMDSLLGGLGISDVWYDEYKPTPQDSKIKIWNKKRCAEIKVGRGKEIGFLGEADSIFLKSLGMENPAILFDINFEKLQKLVSEEHEYRPISQHPAAIKDIAVLVPRGTLTEEVLQRIEIAGGKLARDVDVFDIYEGEELPDGKKSLAFHIIFQAEDRTLSTAEINNLLGKIIKALEENMEWEVRK